MSAPLDSPRMILRRKLSARFGRLLDQACSIHGRMSSHGFALSGPPRLSARPAGLDSVMALKLQEINAQRVCAAIISLGGLLSVNSPGRTVSGARLSGDAWLPPHGEGVARQHPNRLLYLPRNGALLHRQSGDNRRLAESGRRGSHSSISHAAGISASVTRFTLRYLQCTLPAARAARACGCASKYP